MDILTTVTCYVMFSIALKSVSYTVPVMYPLYVCICGDKKVEDTMSSAGQTVSDKILTYT